jgi:hypothetical protein
VSWFRKKNPTADWIGRPDAALVLDLDAFTLQGTRIGDPATSLDLLGPGQPGDGLDEFDFPDRGVTLEIKKDAVTAFHVHFPAFLGAIQFHHQTLRPDSAHGVAGWTALCGEPDVIEDDILTYSAGDREWELLLEDGRLKTISVY